MKIAILSRYHNRIQRGAEVFVRELSRELSLKHTVDILSGEKSDSLEEIIKGAYQIVIAINGGLQSLKASLGRFKKNYKLVISGQAGIGRGEIFNIAVVKPDMFIALTDDMARWARKWAWGSKVIKIPNGIDLDKFSPAGEKITIDLPRPIILSAGALVWYKFHDRVIRAVSEMGEGSVLIVGEGEEKENLEKLGQKLLDKRFKITVYNYSDMPKVYRSVDLFTLPSWDREAFGIVYLEALASGLGVVAPDDLARREIVGEGGRLVDVENQSKYAEAIKEALDIDWTKKSRSQAEKFSWNQIADKYEQAFKDLLT